MLTLLSAYLDERGGAIVRGSRYPMRLDERWSPEPDLLVVRDERRHLLGTNRLEGPADLVIEIASDSDPGLDVREKLPRYREAGIDEIWLVNPFEQIALVEAREPGGYRRPTDVAGRPRFLDRGGLALAGAAPLDARLPGRDPRRRLMPGRRSATINGTSLDYSGTRTRQKQPERVGMARR